MFLSKEVDKRGAVSDSFFYLTSHCLSSIDFRRLRRKTTLGHEIEGR